MWFNNFFKSVTATSSRRRLTRRRPSPARLCLEALEDRCVPSAYSIIPLPLSPQDINAHCQVVGQMSGSSAALWQNGTLTSLGSLAGPGGWSIAYGISDAGQVVGMSYTSTGALRAFLVTPEDTDGNGTPDRWFRDTNADGKNDLMRDLGTLGGTNPASLAWDVNNVGQVVGQSSWNVSNGTTYRAFLWQNGVMTYLGTAGGQDSVARAINDAGLITGKFTNSGSSHAFLWKNGTMTDLGWSSTGGNDINDAGQLVADGRLWTPTVPNGTTGTFTDLGQLPPTFTDPWWTIGSTALGINNAGHVVGYTLEGEAVWGSELYRATLWADGVIEELPLGSAVAINDAGQIVATGGGAYLLTPVPLDLPLVTIGDATVTEGNSGTTDAVFTISLSEPSGQTVTVPYATQDGGDAVSGSDYLATSGTLTFAPGQTSQTISVAVAGDRIGEANETFAVVLSNPGGAILLDPSATGIILDDEPSIDGNSVRVSEGNSGTVTALVTVSLSRAYDQAVTIDYVTENGGATAGSDYLPVWGSLTFAPGQLTQQVAIAVVGDRNVEFGQEDFFLVLSNPSSNASAGVSGRVEIWDDEPRISISPGSLTVTEGNAGTTDAVFTVSLSNAYDQDVTVDYATSDDGDYSPDSAQAGIDYLATAGALRFTPGQTSQTIRVPILGDQIGELDEYFYLNLQSASSNAVLNSNYSVGVILNDDPPEISIYDVTWQEGNTGTTGVTFGVGLSFATTQAVSVKYATANGSGTAGSDYQAASGPLNFAPGETWKTITVQVNGDRLPEANETFFINLSSPTNATIADGQGVCTILDDEPRISISDVAKYEGRKGRTTLLVFTVTLSAAYDQPVTMSFHTVDGTATTSDGDYIAKTGTLTFNPGETSKTIAIEVSGDGKKEANETFYLDLFGNSGNSLFTKKRGIGTILNDD
jgi:probable HAF family extracellular repeat protein